MPEPRGSWQDYLRAVAAAIDTECGRYPGMMDLIYNQVWPMPERLILAALEMTENLVAFGFPQRLALAPEPLPNRSRNAIEALPRRAFDRLSVRNSCGPRGLACLKRNGAWKNDSVKSRRKKT